MCSAQRFACLLLKGSNSEIHAPKDVHIVLLEGFMLSLTFCCCNLHSCRVQYAHISPVIVDMSVSLMSLAHGRQLQPI